MELEPSEFIYGNSYVNWDRISKLGPHRRKRNVYCKDATGHCKRGSGLERVPDFL